MIGRLRCEFFDTLFLVEILLTSCEASVKGSYNIEIAAQMFALAMLTIEQNLTTEALGGKWSLKLTEGSVLDINYMFGQSTGDYASIFRCPMGLMIHAKLVMISFIYQAELMTLKVKFESEFVPFIPQGGEVR